MRGPGAPVVRTRRVWSRAAGALLCLAVAVGPARAGKETIPDEDAHDFTRETRPASVPDDATLEAAGAVIGEAGVVNFSSTTSLTAAALSNRIQERIPVVVP